ncbi:hypothetical protein SASPL_112196 [Salvia splendens]|uniref:Uncharacterized protein n=1 Tax=Salvia splendens TaxID=180675 RepID=A0A8X9A4C5_SALSN|nr:hypothetical protein SASPL_112196 [Salvia splendens]
MLRSKTSSGVNGNIGKTPASAKSILSSSRLDKLPPLNKHPDVILKAHEKTIAASSKEIVADIKKGESVNDRQEKVKKLLHSCTSVSVLKEMMKTGGSPLVCGGNDTTGMNQHKIITPQIEGASKVDRERANKERRSKQNNDKVQKGKGNQKPTTSVAIMILLQEPIMPKDRRETEQWMKTGGKWKKQRKEAAKQSTGQCSKSANSDDEVGSLCLKRGPRQFVKMMEVLNDEQKAAVEEMRFSHLVHYKVTSIPHKLTYEIIDAFDQDSCGVKYQRGILHLCHEDVHATFGLPKGPNRIMTNGHQKKGKFIDELAAAVNRTRKNLGPKILIENMLGDTTGGEFFRKNFIFMFDSILVNLTSDGYCRSQIMDCIDDIWNAWEYNWCAHKTWATDKSKAFTGPISFLVPCYVDRIVMRTHLVPCAFPTIRGWTSQLLNERQKMELNPWPFGRGHKEPILDEKNVGSSEQVNKVCNGVMRVAEARKRWATDGPSFDHGFDVGGKQPKTEVVYYNCQGVLTTTSADHYVQNAISNSRLNQDNQPSDVGVQNFSVEAEIQSVLDAFKEIDVDDDFMNEGLNAKSNDGLPVTATPVPTTTVVVYDNNKSKNVMEKMDVRKRTQRKVSNALRSPYVVRSVKLTNKQSQEESEADMPVYDDDVVKVTKLEL